MTYFKPCRDQSELYAETLDVVQSLINDLPVAPTIMLGDMNAALPQSEHLPKNWYKARPFNNNSLQIYDFLCNNDMCVANYAFNQTVNYTYRKGPNRTYIDHVFIPKYAINDVSSCQIILHDDIVTSDHLPIETVYNLDLTYSKGAKDYCSEQVRYFPRLDWDRTDTRQDYLQHLTHNLQKITPSSDVTDHHNAQTTVDLLCDQITAAIENSCEAVKQSHSNHIKARKKPWWSQDCSTARDCMRFWRRIWVNGGKDRSSMAFSCYKYAKKVYGQVRKTAVDGFNRKNKNILNNLFKYGNSKKFWNKVRILKSNPNSDTSDIDIETLAEFYKTRFSDTANCRSDTVKNAHEQVLRKFYSPAPECDHVTVYERDVTDYVKRLKSGRSGGHDGVLPEHLKYGIGSGISRHLSQMLTLCARHSVIPKSFHLGILVPVLKKPTLDPSTAKHYRPIIVSTVFSKLLEYAILDSVKYYEFHDLQYGFIEQRSTTMAISTAHDIIDYFNNRGTPVYTCALDAEMEYHTLSFYIRLSMLYQSHGGESYTSGTPTFLSKLNIDRDFLTLSKS